MNYIKTQTPVLLVLFFGLSGSLWFLQQKPASTKIPKKDRMDLAWQQEAELMRDPETGDVPAERLYDAWVYMTQLQSKLGKAAIPGVNWTERGPNNFGGRTRAMCVDLNDPTRKTFWAGGVNGGLWKTTDITAAAPNWTVINDFFQTLAVTYIAQAPANPQVMYFCTGEGNNNVDAARGLGVWKSTNGGNTWTQLSATNNSTYYYNSKVFPLGNGDTVFVCTKSGLYRSVNGGTSFSKVLGNGIAGATGDLSYDVERAANGTLYASMSGSGSNTGTIHKSFNGGTTWTSPSTINGINKREIELALADNDTNTIWGLVESSSIIRAIIKSTNAGLSFDTTLAYPNDADGGIPDTDFSRGQAWYDLSIVVDPNNSNVCFVGGVDLFKTSNGGNSWQQVAHWYGGFGFQEVHADQHNAMYEPGNSNVVYFSNDGSVYRSDNATATIPTISHKGTNYNTIQFYACAIHPGAGVNHFLAGAQDNGSHRFSSGGMNATTEVTGGDGAFTHIDQNQAQFQFTSYVYNNYYRSTNTGSSFSGVSFGNTGSFINPTDYDDSLNIMYGHYASNIYFRWNNPQTGNSWDTIRVPVLNGSITHVRVSPNRVRRVYFGTSGGRVVRVDSATSAASAVVATQINSGAGMPTGSISCIEVERGNDNHILVTYSNYGVNSIWETKNGGTTWTSVEGNVPDMPVRWALFNPDKNWQVLLATELGVWSTDSLRGTSTNWQPSSTGLANVRVTQLQMRTSDKLVIASTHGRGLFSSDVFMDPTADFTANKTLSYIGKGIQFTSTSAKATSYLWNFGDGTNSTVANPLKTYTTAGVYTVTLTINSGASSKVLTNYITILPFRGVPYLVTNGGNFESNANDFAAATTAGTGFVRGNSSTAGKNSTRSGSFVWVTGISGNYVDNTTAYLYTPSFNMSVAGTYNLSFYTKHIFETGYDGFILEYSTNGGDSWTSLGTTVATNWYDYANTSSGRPFPTNQAFFNATNSSFTLKTYNVSSLAGNNQVSFRFTFKSDQSSTAAGAAIDDFELTGPTNNPLPVNLLDFTAKRMDKNTVKLNWNTASELNNKGFEIERSDAYTTGFYSLGFVNGKGNATTLSSYSFDDLDNTMPTSFYRLKQVDADGTAVYSDVLVVKGEAALKPGVWTPQLNLLATTNQFVVNLPGEVGARLTLYTSSGQKLAELQVQHGQTLSLDQYAAGIYYTRFESNTGKVFTGKMLLR